MSDILTKIVEKKKQEIKEAEKKTDENLMREIAENFSEYKKRPFFKNLSKPGKTRVNIIAEIKRASPSKGVIRMDIDPGFQAKEYEKGGASAISVLTDNFFFKGSHLDLKAAKKAVNLPVLRKDFIISPYQVYESKIMGADAILFIVRILEYEILRDLMAIAKETGLDFLVEIHSEKDFEIATKAGARLIGVNNRNLANFNTNINQAAKMASFFTDNQIIVAESGIKSRQDIETLMDAGIHNFLIGESIVRAEHPKEFIKSLIGEAI